MTTNIKGNDFYLHPNFWLELSIRNLVKFYFINSVNMWPEHLSVKTSKNYKTKLWAVFLVKRKHRDDCYH